MSIEHDKWLEQTSDVFFPLMLLLVLCSVFGVQKSTGDNSLVYTYWTECNTSVGVLVVCRWYLMKCTKIPKKKCSRSWQHQASKNAESLRAQRFLFNTLISYSLSYCEHSSNWNNNNNHANYLRNKRATLCVALLPLFAFVFSSSSVFTSVFCTLLVIECASFIFYLFHFVNFDFIPFRSPFMCWLLCKPVVFWWVVSFYSSKVSAQRKWRRYVSSLRQRWMIF